MRQVSSRSALARAGRAACAPRRSLRAARRRAWPCRRNRSLRANASMPATFGSAKRRAGGRGRAS